MAGASMVLWTLDTAPEFNTLKTFLTHPSTHTLPLPHQFHQSGKPLFPFSKLVMQVLPIALSKVYEALAKIEHRH
jgi:hypothetical protein